jgi:hypothetical protein
MVDLGIESATPFKTVLRFFFWGLRAESEAAPKSKTIRITKKRDNPSR